MDEISPGDPNMAVPESGLRVVHRIPIQRPPRFKDGSRITFAASDEPIILVVWSDKSVTWEYSEVAVTSDSETATSNDAVADKFLSSIRARIGAVDPQLVKHIAPKLCGETRGDSKIWMDGKALSTANGGLLQSASMHNYPLPASSFVYTEVAQGVDFGELINVLGSSLDEIRRLTALIQAKDS